jgi:hypothetical protein
VVEHNIADRLMYAARLCWRQTRARPQSGSNFPLHFKVGVFWIAGFDLFAARRGHITRL